jgi:hypothetical protein
MPEQQEYNPAGLIRTDDLLSLFVRLSDEILLPGGRVVKIGKIPEFCGIFGASQV